MKHEYPWARGIPPDPAVRRRGLKATRVAWPPQRSGWRGPAYGWRGVGIRRASAPRAPGLDPDERRPVGDEPRRPGPRRRGQLPELLLGPSATTRPLPLANT